uniref:Uncharacterized protein n=1 Tax=Arion vulgaris TaxID=1028688 RepID=A0A0B6ZUC8_9EUPU
MVLNIYPRADCKEIRTVEASRTLLKLTAIYSNWLLVAVFATLCSKGNKYHIES